LAEPFEVETILKYLSPKGLFLIVSAECEEDAKALLKNGNKWSNINI
jgi:hypothetical protein